MPQSILYYPSIDIHDGPWLRSAALYWDEVCSIVPYKEYSRFSPELCYLEERGQYRPIYPADVFLLGNPNDFSKTVKNYFHLKKDSNYDLQSQDLFDEENRLLLQDPSLAALIHYKKIPADIENRLLECGLINRNGDWFQATEEFAFRYMQLLSEYTIRNDEKDIVMGTDKVSRFNDLYPKTRSRNQPTGLSITLEQCLPVPTPDIGFESILDFKEKRKDELSEMRHVLRDFEQTISTCENEIQMKAAVADFREQWERELNGAGKMLRDDKVDFVLGSFRTLVADAGGTAGLLQWLKDQDFLHIPTTAMAAAVGMAGLIGVGACYRDYRSRIKRDAGKNGFAYVLSAKREGLLRPHLPIDII